MPQPMSYAEAYARLFRDLAADKEPVLEAAEVQQLLAEHARAAPWAAETAYATGDRVVTTGRNRRVYVCREPGTSAAAEPDWGSTAAQYLGRAVADGDDLLWQDDGPEHEGLWDLRAAAHAGWLLKAAKSADLIYFASAGQMFSLQQRHAHCLAMAARYAPLTVC